MPVAYPPPPVAIVPFGHRAVLTKPSRSSAEPKTIPVRPAVEANAVASRPSRRSAFRFATLAELLTRSGGRPGAARECEWRTHGIVQRGRRGCGIRSTEQQRAAVRRVGRTTGEDECRRDAETEQHRVVKTHEVSSFSESGRAGRHGRGGVARRDVARRTKRHHAERDASPAQRTRGLTLRGGESVTRRPALVNGRSCDAAPRGSWRI